MNEKKNSKMKLKCAAFYMLKNESKWQMKIHAFASSFWLIL